MPFPDHDPGLNPAPARPQPGSNAPELSVSELSGAIKRALEDGFAQVRVRGEMGRITIARSGHFYVDLKDANAVLSAVMWKGAFQSLRFRPEEGMEVVATGRISTFPGSSRYQLIIERLEPAGVGALLQQLEERRKRLAAEGLFDPARKQPLPVLPAVIGVVTSPTGAVIRDILHRLSDRFPVHVLLWPVLVQGEKAPAQVARAITGFNAIAPGGPVPRPDLIIVARGGGSIEDLWAFNEEVVVRAAAASAIPLISAVGHETDTTLIDFAADLRAPTPTGAAEKAVPVRAELLERTGTLGARLAGATGRLAERARLRLAATGGRLPRLEALLGPARQRLDLADTRLAPAMRARLASAGSRLAEARARLRRDVLLVAVARREERLAALEARREAAFARLIERRGAGLSQQAQALATLERRLATGLAATLQRAATRLDAAGKLLGAVSYQGVLARGFALVRSQKGTLVRSASQAKGRLTIAFADGDVDVTARGPEGAPPPPPVQGSLF